MRLTVTDIFRAGTKTIFSGKMDEPVDDIEGLECKILVNDVIVGDLIVGGYVLTGHAANDIWTNSVIDLERKTINQNIVLVVSE